ncbi:MAG: tRNA (N6-isopentenyl adenosine(37)-C2)-methylthiotransferase MiaB [Chitinispirillaceae bacterium]|nr:tRNA (N6-isopentenyl adenosine(37)-C2)-methylthiotransferase MiaB [Chitinispirillaceae bacterium]
MPYLYFHTFGCQMNVADSNEIAEMLFSRGFVETKKPSEADLLIVNTCSVREHAEKRALARIYEFSKVKKKGAKLWVIGCMAERLGEKLTREIPSIDKVIGSKSLNEIEEIIDKTFSLPLVYEDSNEEKKVTDFVTITRGCNNYCSYCIVPYVRGPEVYLPVSEILENVKRKVDKGVKEVTLLGQNVNSYFYEKYDFSDLLSLVAEINGIERIRFMTSHPKDLSEKLIKTIANLRKCCHHIHLPMQAGSDRILNLMNRAYTSSKYLELIEMIRVYIPDADITTDIIVGFPSEKDTEFEETLSMVRKIKFTTAFMFAYSVREGTKAAELPDDVPRSVKLNRLKKLIELQTEITRKLYGEMVGKEIEIFISSQQDKEEWLGYDYGFKRAAITCNGVKAGMILKGKVIKSTGMTLVCERI